LSSIPIELADAIVSLIQGESYPEAPVVSREWVPRFNQSNLDSAYIVQVIIANRKILPGTRGPSKNEHNLKIGVFTKVSGDDANQKTLADTCFDLAQNIGELLSKKVFTIDSRSTSVAEVDWDAVYDSDLLKDERIFASIIALTLEGVR